jgi:hypothetical protein
MPKTLGPEALASRLFVTANEAAALLRWDARTVRNLIHEGDRQGRKYLPDSTGMEGIQGPSHPLLQRVRQAGQRQETPFAGTARVLPG